MIIGSCPYCDHAMWFTIGDRSTPFWGHKTCEACGKTFWEEYSRIDPKAWTEEAFADEFEVDEATRGVRKKPGEPVNPLVAEINDRIMRGLVDQAVEEYRQQLEGITKEADD